MTIKERILRELERDDALHDDELGDRLAVQPRQAINQAARALEREGRITRRKDRGHKIVNLLRR